MPDLSKRKNQVDSEAIKPIDAMPYSASRIVVHEHAADRAGKHYDIRLDINGKAVSFATKKGLPTGNAPIQFFRQPDHNASYMDWEGDIPTGEYGAGKVKKAIDHDIVAKAEPTKINFTISEGPYKGRYAIMRKDENSWLAVKKKELEHHWEPRPKYTELESAPENHGDYVTTEKLDGAHFIAKFNSNGISFTSQRKAKDGSIIRREDSIPHLSDIKVPSKYQGMVVRGELWHDKGFNVLSGILNSKAPKAVETQKREGLIRFAPFRVVQGPKGEHALSYEEQYELLKGISKELPHYFEPPKRFDNHPRDAFEEIGRRKGEGIIMASKSGDEQFKMKHRFDYDLRISGFTEGTGKYHKNAIGAIMLEDRNGNDVGMVGTGLSDELRRDMFKRPKHYIGKLVKVESRKPLKGKLREPSLLGLTLDKNEPDEVK